MLTVIKNRTWKQEIFHNYAMTTNSLHRWTSVMVKSLCRDKGLSLQQDEYSFNSFKTDGNNLTDGKIPDLLFL